MSITLIIGINIFIIIIIIMMITIINSGGGMLMRGSRASGSGRDALAKWISSTAIVHTKNRQTKNL